MSLKDAAEREALLKVVHEQVKKAYDDAREETQRELEAAKKTTGTSRVDAELPDGTPLATTSYTKPQFSAIVTDPAKFLAFVRANYPSEITTRLITEVREAFVKTLLAQMTAAGTPRVVDKETGEVHDVPGVEIKPTKKAGHSVRLADGATDAIAEAWQTGQLAHLLLPQLAAGPTEGAA